MKVLTKMFKFSGQNGCKALILLFLIAVFSWNIMTMKSEVYDGNQRLFTVQVAPAESVPIHMVITAVNNRSTLDAIELCSVYSMASSHPNRTVIVHVRAESPDMHLWSNLDNVIIRLINDSTVCADTPAEQFYAKFVHKLMPKSKFGVVELSDILRVCIIYRLGGTYVDTDVIQIASFDESIEEFVLNEKGKVVNGLFHFRNKENKLLGNILAKMDKSFALGVWGTIGKNLFASEFDGNSNIVKMPEDLILPIKYDKAVAAFLDPARADSTKATISAKKSIGVHVYRTMIYWSYVKIYSSDSYLAKIIKDRCKPIYQQKVVCANSNNATIDDSNCLLPFEGKLTD